MNGYKPAAQVAFQRTRMSILNNAQFENPKMGKLAAEIFGKSIAGKKVSVYKRSKSDNTKYWDLCLKVAGYDRQSNAANNHICLANASRLYAAYKVYYAHRALDTFNPEQFLSENKNPHSIE